MLRSVCALISCTCYALVGFAQQVPVSGQFHQQATRFNPAAITSDFIHHDQTLRLQVAHRSQWTELETAPQTSMLNADVVLADYGPVSPMIGLSVGRDKTGPTSQTDVRARLGGMLRSKKDEWGVSLAFEAGLSQYRLNGADLHFQDAEVAVPVSNQMSSQPDVSVGVYAYARRQEATYTFGLSVPQLIGLKTTLEGEERSVELQRYQHLFATLGADFYLPFGRLESVVWMRAAKNAPLDVALQGMLHTESAFSVGGGFTAAHAIHGTVGARLGDLDDIQPVFRLLYTFEYLYRNVGPYAGPSHEVSLTYSIAR